MVTPSLSLRIVREKGRIQEIEGRIQEKSTPDIVLKNQQALAEDSLLPIR